MEWYREMAHIGYDLEGKPIKKPKSGDELDEFLEKMDNPDYWFVFVSFPIQINEFISLTENL